jgi:hypothetical protein
MTTCSRVGCKKEATWHFNKQWHVCDDHVNEAEKELQDNVDSTIKRERSIMVKNEQRKTAYTIYSDEISDLVFSETDIATKVAIAERVRSRTNPSNAGEYLHHNALADEDGQLLIFKGGSREPMNMDSVSLVSLEGLLPFQELKITLHEKEE